MMLRSNRDLPSDSGSRDNRRSFSRGCAYGITVDDADKPVLSGCGCVKKAGQVARLPVNFAAVADGEYADFTGTVVDFVENAIIVDANAPLVAAAGKFPGVVRAGKRAELIDSGANGDEAS